MTEINLNQLEAEMQARIQQAVKDTNTQAKSCAVRASNELRNAALNVLRGQRRGRVYKKPHSKATYTASAPGEPPAVRTGMRRAAAVKLVERCEQARLVIVIAVVIRRGEIADPGVHKPVQHPGGRVHARIAVRPGLAGLDLRLVAAEGRGGIDRRFQICRRQVGGQVEVRDGIEQVRRVRIADAVDCHAVRAVADGDAPLR